MRILVEVEFPGRFESSNLSRDNLSNDYVCMYVCMYVYIYIYIHMCIYIYI